ncbi:MAG: hypothetical protein J1F60_04325 [Oscillospiraceae bacterium]|nr:hypothetical protein [Oscillospiraceae bacterium]
MKEKRQMKNFFRGISLVMAAAMLLCGCKDSNGQKDIDLVGDTSEDIAPVTSTSADTTTTATEEEPVKPDEVIYEGVYDIDENGVGSMDPVEYKLYYKNGETGESTLLYEHVKKGAFYKDISYAVVDDEQTPFMIAYNNENKSENDIGLVTAYTAQYGELEILGFIDAVKNDEGEWEDISEILGHTMMIIRDGDHILRSFCNDKKPQFEELFILENGIYDYDQPQSVYKEAYHFVRTPSFAKENLYFLKNGSLIEYTEEMLMEYFGHTLDEFYICPDCGDGYEYFIWADKDRNWFWYHPESGINEPIELTGDLNYDVFIAKAE